jgi:hypothetical protein
LGEPTRRPGFVGRPSPNPGQIDAFGTLPTDPPWEGVPVRGPVVRRPAAVLPPGALSDEYGNEPPPTVPLWSGSGGEDKGLGSLS